jgi:isopenicillin N synthase-like dioxygenase
MFGRPTLPWVSELPVIDVAPLVEASAPHAAVEATAAAIDGACREAGFFYVVGHGVDERLVRQLDESARRFFALPDAEKAEIAMARAGRAWRGWFPLGGELTSGVPDLKEGLYFGAELPSDDPRVRAGVPLHGPNLFPRRPGALRAAVLAHLDAMTRLGQALLSGMAMGLGLERSWFAEHLTADPVLLFRIFCYPPAPLESDGWGVAEHTDYGLLTIVGQDRHGGLEVRTPRGWIDADPIPGSFVCNIGDMLERLTGGRYRSTPHRVRNSGTRTRLSFPFFLDPSWDAVVEHLPIVERPADDDSAAERWDHTSVHGFAGTYGEYLLAKVAQVFPDLAGEAAVEP